MIGDATVDRLQNGEGFAALRLRDTVGGCGEGRGEELREGVPRKPSVRALTVDGPAPKSMRTAVSSQRDAQKNHDCLSKNVSNCR